MQNPKEWTSKALDEPHAKPRPTNLIINYLPKDTSDEELYDIFSTFGAIRSSKIIRDNFGSCVGYGFVDFVNSRFAHVAQMIVNGRELRGKHLKVSFALPRGIDIAKCNLFVKYLPVNVNKEELENLFETHGTLSRVKVVGDKFNGMMEPQLNVAYVRFREPADAEKAKIALDGYCFPGAKRPISVQIFTRRENPRVDEAQAIEEGRWNPSPPLGAEGVLERPWSPPPARDPIFSDLD